ncbi:MAG TPA: PKD domain-containing protein, partial [Chloroflexota bacterium]|nr:PKD domain-containing protein [Chloroflexota bacterium]
PQPGDTVQFTDTSTHPHAPTDSIVSWSWTFGDGGTSTLQNPSHVFANQCQCSVTLTVTDDDGLTASITRMVNVGAAPPVAAFHTDPAAPTDLDNIHFLDDSFDPDGTVVAWHWNFGDGATSDLQNPFHDYADSGSFPVTLTVTDDTGLTGTLTRVLEVLNVAPTADFAYSPILPVAGFPTSFTDASHDPDGSIVSWAWDFGDGGTSTAQNPSHTFATGGNYIVSLTVADNHGATASVSKTVHVCQPPGGIIIGPGLQLNLELCIA